MTATPRALWSASQASSPMFGEKIRNKRRACPKGYKISLGSQEDISGNRAQLWVYVPKQCNVGTPASLMIFQDGEWYLFDAMMEANIVLDNLTHKKEIPVIIGVSIHPGDQGAGNPDIGGSDNRSVEYDTIRTMYPRLVIYSDSSIAISSGRIRTGSFIFK